MKCKNCGNELPAGSLFCMYCGTKIVKTATDKKEIKVPPARKLPSGNWRVQVWIDGKAISVTEPTEKEAIARAKALKAGLIQERNRGGGAAGRTLNELTQAYIEKYETVLSPSTIRSYEIMRKNRFQAFIDKPYKSITNWQLLIDGEKEKAPKTVKSAWALLARVINEAGLQVPAVVLPALVRNERPYLTAEQIPVFMEAIKGTNAEIPALLALHSLRCSEIYALTPEKVDLNAGIIHVRGAVVPDKNNKMVEKKTNKNSSSARDVPIMIPRLKELLTAAAANGGYNWPTSCRVGATIAKKCAENNLPEIRFHGLRHSFVTLAVHTGMDAALCQRIGGWEDITTMRKIYTHISESDKLKAANAITEFFNQN